MNNELVQWQKLDDSGVCYPWFTHPFLDVLEEWELRDKVILEFGGGKSTKWWASRAKEVWTIETSENWISEIKSALNVVEYSRVKLFHRQVNEGDQTKVDYYTELPQGCKPDIVVIDGVLRHECLLKALTLPRPIIIIHDNWQQDGFVCPSSEEVMKPFDIHNFIQENHTDNNGKKWATAYWNIPA